VCFGSWSCSSYNKAVTGVVMVDALPLPLPLLLIIIWLLK
jgi:hypothetical protein